MLRAVDRDSHSLTCDPEPTLAACTLEVGSRLRSAMAATCASPPECTLNINDGCNATYSSLGGKCVGTGSGVCDAAKIATSVDDQVSLVGMPADGCCPRKIHLEDGHRIRKSFVESIAKVPQPHDWNNGPQGAGQSFPIWGAGEVGSRSEATDSPFNTWSSSGSVLMSIPPPVDAISNSRKDRQESASNCVTFEVGSRLRSAVAATCARPPECQLSFEESCETARCGPPGVFFYSGGKTGVAPGEEEYQTWSSKSYGEANGAVDQDPFEVGFGGKVSDLPESWASARKSAFDPLWSEDQHPSYQAKIQDMQLLQCLGAFSPFIRQDIQR